MRRRSALFGLLIAVAVASLPDVPVDVVVDLTATAAPFSHYWKKTFGSGHAALSLRADWQAHLKQAVTDLGLGGVRYHGIFDDDMGPVVTGGPGQRVYNFTLIDKSWDYQIGLGLKPVVELSFMPSALAGCTWHHNETSNSTCKGWCGENEYCTKPVKHYQGVTMVPAGRPPHWDEWYDLVRALAAHAVSRYGLAEVAQWHFEVWNELWGMAFPRSYMPLYNASARAIKSVDPSLKVGG
jgi:xylan 1,4-beta-xylosidase